ncbi:sulfurtransferase complex subunit TusC [Cellvibrio mixtus]|uniref:sulfurtransferase complex subunit TusC n=1 Tax=Cellvibrio mixtus TaxID=39650 RepID=UPI00058712AF|nr:sulfurtransferase complex subunit TusC [Cellvibrio mixtus]
MHKKILLISRHAPYGNSIAKDAFDAALATAIYDQDLSMLFMDDGIFQLLRDQQAQEISQKSFTSMLSALPFYDIDKLYIHQESLEQRGLTIENLIVDNATIVNSAQISNLLNHQDHILSF